MAEFRERSSLSRLLGAPPGYIGYGEPGLLSGTLRRRPHSLVLLKNLDLAHPEVSCVWNSAIPAILICLRVNRTLRVGWDCQRVEQEASFGEFLM